VATYSLFVGLLWKPSTKKKKRQSSGPKNEVGLLLKEIPIRNTSAGAGSSSVPLRGLAETSEPAVEISANGRDEPVVRNMPEVKPKTSLLAVSSSDIPLQGVTGSSTPTVREDLGHLVSGGRWTPSGEEDFDWFH
jgi:hypothetical protein